MATTKAYEIGQLGSKLTVDSDGDISLNTINSLLVDTNTLTVDPSNNRVGIGTASPNRKLTIAGGNDAKIAFTEGGTQSLYFGDGAGAAEYAGYIHYAHTDDQMRFNTSTDFTFMGGGVGIGTTSPDTSSKLHTYTTNPTARTITETSQSGGYSGYRMTNGTGYWEMQVDGSNQSLRFLDDGAERLDISSTSQVTVYGHIKPNATLSYDLGDSDNRFRDIYLSGQTINLAGTKLSVDSSGDLELKDLSNNFKKIRAKEVEFDDATDSDHKTVLKRDNSGRMSFVKVRRSDGVELTDSADKVRLDFDNMTTADLTEHTKNKYFTDARARGSVSISNVSGHGSLGYNSSTGVISYTGISTSTIRGLISVSGDLSYNSSTGVISTQGLASSTTDNLSEGSTNLYFTNARADARIAAATTADLSEDSSNLYFTNARADARIAAATTDDLTEGSNLYYTQARFNSAFTAKSTTNLSEGSNLYYTTARSDSDTGVYIAGNRTFGNITTTGYIAGPSTLTIDPAGVGDNTGTVVIAGDLQVDGTTTTINSTTVTLDDHTLVLASGSTSASQANGAGIVLDGADTAITYNASNDRFASKASYHIQGRGGSGSYSRFSAQNDSDGAGHGGALAYLQSAGWGEAKLGLGANTFSQAGGQLQIATGGQKVYVNSGNFGIGTNNAQKKLEVVGDIQLDATDASLWIKSGATGTSGFINWTFNTDDTVYNKVGMEYNTRATTGFHIDAGYPITIDATASGGKAINFAVGGSTKAVVNGSGNVGIGTTIPTEKLQFNVESGATEAIFFEDNASVNWGFKLRYIESSNKFQIQGLEAGSQTAMLNINRADGNVGIGTTSPSAKLHVVGGSDANLYLKSDSTRSGAFLMKPGTDVVMGSLLQLSDETYRLGTASYYHVQMNQDGKTILNATGNTVGIGTASPNSNAILDVDGGANKWVIFTRNGKDLYVNANYSGADNHAQIAPANASNMDMSIGASDARVNDIYIKQSTGYVGMGTTNPQSTLEVCSTDRARAPLVLQGSHTNGVVLLAHHYLGSNEYYNTQGMDYSTNAWMIGSSVYVDGATSRKQLSTQDNYASRGASLYVDGANGIIDFYTSNSNATRTKGTENTDITRRLRINASGSVVVKGTDDNSGRADFGVNAGGNPTVSLHGNYIYAGSSDLNYNARWSYSSSSATSDISVWSGNLQFSLFGSGDRDIFFKALDNGTSTEVMRIKGANASVGIGESAPLGKLHVKDGDAGSITTNSAHDTVIIEGSGNTGINIFSPNTSFQYLAFGDTEGANSGYVRYQHSTNQMVLRAGGADAVYVNSDGHVGIGTTSPGGLLTVYNSSTSGNTRLHVHNDKSGDAAELRLEGKRTSNNDTGQLLYVNSGNVVSRISANSAADDGDLRFFTSATGSGSVVTERMRITTTGNVSIGSASNPSDKLYVTGGRTKLEVQNVPNAVVASNSSTVIEATEAQLQIIGVDTGSWASNLTLTNAPASGNNKHWTMHHTPASHPTISNALQFNYLATNTVGEIGGDGTGAAAEAKMTITNAGNVGIGTETPNAQIHIGGSSAEGDATNPALQIGGSTSYRLGMYTTAEGGVIDAANGDDGLIIHTKVAGEALRITSEGAMIAGSKGGTAGSKVLRQRYNTANNDHIATMGTMYSSGAWLLGYGVDPKNGSAGYVSSYDNFSGHRSAFEFDSRIVKFHYGAAQQTAVGSDITGFKTPFSFDLDDAKLTIYREVASSTMLELHNHQADIDGDGFNQGSFIDFKMTDGNATFTPQARIGMVVGESDGGDAGIPSEGSGNFQIYTGNGTDGSGGGNLDLHSRFGQNGRLKIFTPGNTTDGTYYSTVTIDNTGSSTWSRLRFDRSGVARWGLSLGTDDKFKISNLYTSGSTENPEDNVFVIDNASRIGMGTASPGTSYKLDVVGSQRLQGTGSVTLDINADTSNTSGEAGHPEVRFWQDGGTGTYHMLSVGSDNAGSAYSGTTANSSYIVGGTGHGGVPLHLGSNGTVRMTIAAGGAISMNQDVTIDSSSSWNAGNGMLNVGGAGDGRIQVRHIWGKSASSAGTDDLWLQYSNAGQHVQIGANNGGNHLYVSGNIYANGYFGGSEVWHEGNDGQGSGLYADKIGGRDFAYGTFTVGGNSSTYYPCTFWGGSQDEPVEIEIFRRYSDTAPSDWNTASHKGHITLKLTVNFGGWGGSNYNQVVHDFRETYSTICTRIGRFGNQRGFAIWLRGGTAVYNYRVRGRTYGPTVRLTAYDPGGNNTGVSSQSYSSTNVNDTIRRYNPLYRPKNIKIYNSAGTEVNRVYGAENTAH